MRGNPSLTSNPARQHLHKPFRIHKQLITSSAPEEPVVPDSCHKRAGASCSLPNPAAGRIKGTWLDIRKFWSNSVVNGITFLGLHWGKTGVREPAVTWKELSHTHCADGRATHSESRSSYRLHGFHLSRTALNNWLVCSLA